MGGTGVYDAILMQPRRSLIALATDFGTRDPYVAAMKGVIRSGCDAELMDLSHEIGPYDILEAAAFLHAVLPWLPCEGDRFDRVVVLCVVDPGVGSDRRIAVVEQDGRWLIAPDNGILAPLVSDGRGRLLSETRWDLPRVSRTFHGRDRFAPLAAAVANGENLDPAVDPLTPLALWPRSECGAGYVLGTVISIDRFGNCVTDVPAQSAGTNSILRTAEGRSVDRWAMTYAEMESGEAYLLEGSRATVEVSMKQASAADLLQLSRGDRVRIERVDSAP